MGSTCTTRLPEIGLLRDAIASRYRGETMTIKAVVDYSDRPTNAQLKLGFLAAFDRRQRGVRVIPVTVQQFNTPQASSLVAQHAFPPAHLELSGGAVMVNVAKIAETVEGVRQDHTLIAVCENGTLVVGYSARDKCFGTILDHCKVVFRVEIPKEDRPELGIPGAQHRHFRSRDILPVLMAGIVAGDAAWEETLVEAYTPAQARTALGIRSSDDWNGWFPDEPYGNLKTDIRADDPRLANFKFGDRVLVKMGEITHEAVFAASLGDVPRGCLGVVRGSSSINFPGNPVKLLDIMFRAGSALKVLHDPPQGTPIEILPAA